MDLEEEKGADALEESKSQNPSPGEIDMTFAADDAAAANLNAKHKAQKCSHSVEISVEENSHPQSKLPVHPVIAAAKSSFEKHLALITSHPMKPALVQANDSNSPCTSETRDD